MSIDHTCFVSYPHPGKEGSYLDVFVQDLIAELDERLDGFLPGNVYWDKPRLKATYDYDVALSQAICRSTCMIVIYCPEYARREYCRREFDLMNRINERRRGSLGMATDKQHFIALVSLAQRKLLPQRLQSTSWHVADFSSYMTLPNNSKRRIRASKALRENVQGLATAVQELHGLIGGRGAFGSSELCCGEAIGNPDSVPEWEPAPFPR